MNPAPTLSRRGLLGATGAGLIVGFLAGCALPVIPKRPSPDATVALGWIRHAQGRYTLYLPRVEMGQNILTAVKQLACDELGIGWDELDARLVIAEAWSSLRPSNLDGSRTARGRIESPATDRFRSTNLWRHLSGEDLVGLAGSIRPYGVLVGAEPIARSGQSVQPAWIRESRQ